MTLSEAKKYYDLNQVQLLVISSEKRLKELPEIPTWTEEGIDVVLNTGAVLWDHLICQKGNRILGYDICKNGQNQRVETNFADIYVGRFYMNSRDTSRFLDEENKKYEKLLEIY